MLNPLFLIYAKVKTIFTGLFCHHVLPVFEHVRLEKIPKKYILQRYTKNAVTDPNFNSKDYKTSETGGTSLEYRRTILYNEAIKTVNRGCYSDEMFEMVPVAFREVNARMETSELDVDSNNRTSANGEVPQGSSLSDNVSVTEDGDQFADLQPPPVARTKGSRNKEQKGKNSAPARPQPELDNHGVPKGQRLCSICKKSQGTMQEHARRGSSRQNYLIHIRKCTALLALQRKSKNASRIC